MRGARDAALVAAACERGDPDALQALVAEHQALVARIARRYAARRDDVEDLIQEGIVGLLTAVRRYDPTRGVPFEAYAAVAVEGEIRHHLRDRSSCLRLPEPVQGLRGRLRRLAEDARARTGREPPIAELATLAGVGHEEAARAATAGLVPLEADLVAQVGDAEAGEARAELRARLARLDRRGREVVYLRFFADLTQHEIADRLGMSQMHVSRLLRRALETMQADVTEDRA